MPKPCIRQPKLLAARRSSGRCFSALAILVVVVAKLAACVACLDHRRTADDQILAPATASDLSCCAAVQGSCAHRVWRQRGLARMRARSHTLDVLAAAWRRRRCSHIWPSWSLARCHDRFGVFGGGFAGYTLTLLPLAAGPQIVLEGWRRWSQNRRPRRLAWLVYVSSILLLVGSEAGLQAYRLAAIDTWLPGSRTEIRDDNAAGRVCRELPRAPASRFASPSSAIGVARFEPDGGPGWMNRNRRCREWKWSRPRWPTPGGARGPAASGDNCVDRACRTWHWRSSPRAKI